MLQWSPNSISNSINTKLCTLLLTPKIALEPIFDSISEHSDQFSMPPSEVHPSNLSPEFILDQIASSEFSPVMKLKSIAADQEQQIHIAEKGRKIGKFHSLNRSMQQKVGHSEIEEPNIQCSFTRLNMGVEDLSIPSQCGNPKTQIKPVDQEITVQDKYMEIDSKTCPVVEIIESITSEKGRVAEQYEEVESNIEADEKIPATQIESNNLVMSTPGIGEVVSINELEAQTNEDDTLLSTTFKIYNKCQSTASQTTIREKKLTFTKGTTPVSAMITTVENIGENIISTQSGKRNVAQQQQNLAIINDSDKKQCKHIENCKRIYMEFLMICLEIFIG